MGGQNELFLNSEFLIYNNSNNKSPKDYYLKPKSFRLKLDNISTISICRKMYFDEDIFFLVFTDKANNLNYLCLDLLIDMEIKKIETYFDFNSIIDICGKMNLELDYNYPVCKVIYPKELFFKDLFKKNLRFSINSLLPFKSFIRGLTILPQQ